MLIALATAGVLASATAVAREPAATLRDHDARGATIVPVQYDRADERAGSINEREARLSARIQRGQRDGRITEREARRLYRELSDIESKERAFGANGRISGREEAELTRDLDRLNGHIRDQMRDEQRRY
jgi:hypothetical protein